MPIEAILGIIAGWCVVGGIVFLFMQEDSNMVSNANWLQLCLLCFLCGPLTFIGFLIYFSYSMLGKMGKLFNR